MVINIIFCTITVNVICCINIIATILYLYLYVLNIDNVPEIGDMLFHGIIGIFGIGLLISLNTRYIVYRNRLRAMHERIALNQIIESLTNLSEESSKHKDQCVLEKFVNNPWSTTTDLAYLLIEFERHIKYNRLDRNFLQTRNDWILALLSCDDEI